MHSEKRSQGGEQYLALKYSVQIQLYYRLHQPQSVLFQALSRSISGQGCIVLSFTSAHVPSRTTELVSTGNFQVSHHSITFTALLMYLALGIQTLRTFKALSNDLIFFNDVKWYCKHRSKPHSVRNNTIFVTDDRNGWTCKPVKLSCLPSTC